jgi:hypothetical protein
LFDSTISGDSGESLLKFIRATAVPYKVGRQQGTPYSLLLTLYFLLLTPYSCDENVVMKDWSVNITTDKLSSMSYEDVGVWDFGDRTIFVHVLLAPFLGNISAPEYDYTQHRRNLNVPGTLSNVHS